MDNTILKRQYGLLIFLLPFVFKLAMLPCMLAELAGNDVWLAALIMLVADGLQLALVVEISRCGGIDAVIKKMGKKVFLALSVPLVLCFVAKSTVYIAELVNYVTSFLFYNISNVNPTIFLVAIMAYIAVKGVGAIGRLAEVVLWTLPLIVIAGIAFGATELHFEYVNPVLANGFAPVGQSILKNMFWTFDLTPLLFVKFKPSKYPNILFGVLGMIAAITFIFIIFVANYNDAGFLMDNAIARLATFNVVNTEIGSIDWITVAIWLALAMLMLGLYCYSGARVIQNFNIKNGFSVTIFSVIVLALSVFWLNNMEKAEEFAVSWVRYVVVALELIVPVVMLCALKARATPEADKEAVKGSPQSDMTVESGGQADVSLTSEYDCTEVSGE